MGHRALVAYRRPDRLYDLRYSHWGGENAAFGRQITPETPLASGSVTADLLADSVARDRILTDFLNPCIHEALYLVDPDANYDVTAYRVCWLEWGDGRNGGRGAIVAVESDAADRRVRTWFRATKTALGDLIEMGALSRRAAQAYLESRVCADEDGTVYTYVGDDPESDVTAYTPTPDRWLEDDWWQDVTDNWETSETDDDWETGNDTDDPP
ncbi:DUF6735 family protein [Natronorubrum bangense]|uniref:Uncharacterized protein n=2 Tax=Natronorubrum bangense TaxID=61858 RepID=L9WQY6_9EURY|nr:DUF6735 family protein [Natronorubrum bangense]ELY51822.1 hypothetical protein C494_01766 [Natronorubrum bangense JCM 10635]QCC54944.1 hypothetical protein DV706_10980 [Natronorubrum bangense]